MPFIMAAVADAQEDKPLPEGEYELTIKSAEPKTSKKGKNMIQVLLVTTDPEYRNASPINHYIMLPEKDDEYRDMHLRNMKRFLVAFGVAFEDNGFDTDDLIGQTATVGVGLQAMKDRDTGEATGQEMNTLKLPRVKDEEEAQPSRKKAGSRRR